MKNTLLKSTCFIALCTSMLLTSCSKNAPNNETNQSNPNSNTASDNKSTNENTNTETKSNTENTSDKSSSTEKTFTLEDLKKYDGQNGNPAYVAVNGNVYDVTNAKKWKNGKHVSGVVAGVDLTNTIGNSPHGTSVLKDVPIVGTLRQ